MPSLIFIRFFLACLCYAMLTGCAPNAAMIPPAERTRLADTAIADAVTAYNAGNLERGDAGLKRAVILLTSGLDGGFSDEGYIAVAKRIMERGRPQDAIRLLEPLTPDKRVAWNPVLWATLADAAEQASIPLRAAEARARAKQTAEFITQEFGATVPMAKDRAMEKAERASRAGAYFDAYAKDYPRALEACREAYRLLPNDLYVANNLGYLLAEHGTTPDDYKEAVRLTQTVVEKAAPHPVFLDSFGWALYKRGDAKQKDHDGARRRLREAVDLAPDLFECRYHLAVVYDALEMPREALVEARFAAKLKPDDANAKTLLTKLQSVVAALPSPAPSPTPSPTATGK